MKHLTSYLRNQRATILSNRGLIEGLDLHEKSSKGEEKKNRMCIHGRTCDDLEEKAVTYPMCV